MPFKSDKQRRYLWSQKPEVAKQIAHKQSGGGVYSSGIYDDSADWWNRKMAGIPQHVGFVDDPDDITETPLTNPDDPYGGRFVNPDRAQPKGRYTDLATYYTAKQRAMGRGEKELIRMKIENERIKREALKRGFINPDGSTNFQEGGEVPMMDNRKPKKVTQKDRYGNQVTVEYESEAKPFDINSLLEKTLDMQVPEMQIPTDIPGIGGFSVGFADHPGEPKGSDTVPAWLTPGEFVVNAEAMRIPGVEEQVTQMNDMGRAVQQQQGGSIPHGYADGGSVPVPVSPTEALLHAREGYRPDVYLDSLKKPTVGYGHLLPEEYRGRVGEQPFSEDQLSAFFQEDMATAEAGAKRNAEKYGVKWDDLSRREKIALTSQAFQLGETGQGKFENMWTKLAAGDKEGAALEALDSRWAEQTPERAKDLYSAFQPNLGFNNGGPVYAWQGMGMPNEWDISDPMADLTGGWTPPVYEADEISPMEQAILDEEAQLQERNLAQAENMVEGGDGDDLGTAPTGTPALGDPYDEAAPVAAMPAASSIPMPDEMSGDAPEEMGDFWSGVSDWVFDTSVADERNAAFNVKATEANAEAAEETLAELEQRVEDGQPVNSHTLEGAQAAVEHTAEQHEEAVIEAAAAMTTDGEIDYEGVVEAETALQQSNVPGPDDDKAALEELAESDEFENEDDPSKDSEKGTQSTEEVVTAGEEAAQADPTLVEKAKGFFEGAFSDLFDGKELARMAIMYVGSRALGYSHGGSLNWAAKQYVARLDAKQTSLAQNAKEFTKSGKFTPASVAAYQKTGDFSKLQPVGAVDNITGNVNTRTVNGQKVAFQEIKRGDHTLYKAPDGSVYTAAQLENATQPYEASFQKGTPEYRARRSRATGDAAGRFEEVWKAEDTIPGGRDKPDSHFTNIRPKQAADEFWAWSEGMGLDPESDEALQIMTQAYRQAIQDGQTGDVKPGSLKPYLEQQYIREKSGAPELFVTNPGAKPGEAVKYVRGDKMAQLDRNIQSVAVKLPGLQGLSPKDATDRFYQLAVEEWGALDADVQKQYNRSATKDESGFYLFMNKRASDLLNKAGG